MNRDTFTIQGIIKIARAEYKEAQREGLDSNNAFNCVIERLQELVNIDCNCDFTEPYGFVPEAGCLIHDN